jgi:outer membrane protein assembly factor BamC
MLHVYLYRRIAATLVAASLAALLAGCETMTTSVGKKIDYKSSASAPALEIPPDLTTPAYDDRYFASTASGAAAARAAGKPSEILPPNPEARLVRAGSERWVVVKATPEAAWNTLREFWTQNGFVVAVEQPALGIMETDWAENRAAAPQSALAKTVGKYIEFLTDTYRRDKFRTRSVFGNETATAEIYISHKGAARSRPRSARGRRRLGGNRRRRTPNWKPNFSRGCWSSSEPRRRPR